MKKSEFDSRMLIVIFLLDIILIIPILDFYGIINFKFYDIINPFLNLIWEVLIR